MLWNLLQTNYFSCGFKIALGLFVSHGNTVNYLKMDSVHNTKHIMYTELNYSWNYISHSFWLSKIMWEWKVKGHVQLKSFLIFWLAEGGGAQREHKIKPVEHAR